MAFSDPQSVTISAVTTPLPRTNVGNNGSDYTSADGLIKLNASNAYGRRTRRVLRLDHSKITADPFIPAQNVMASMSVYLVADVPSKNVGYSPAEQLAVYAGLKGQMTAASDALVSKLLAGES